MKCARVDGAKGSAILHDQVAVYLEGNVRGGKAGKLRHRVRQVARDGLDLLRRQRLVARDLRSKNQQVTLKNHAVACVSRLQTSDRRCCGSALVGGL